MFAALIKLVKTQYFNRAIYILSKYHDHDLLSCNGTQITLKSKQEFPGLMNFTFLVYFPILSSKDDNRHNRFRHELGSARVKFHRLNQQSNLIVWVEQNRY